MTKDETIIRDAYAAFNRKDADAALSTMTRDVAWADGEGHILHGRDAVRAHWTEQWKAMDVTIEPLRFTHGAGDRTDVEARVTTRDRRGGGPTDRIVTNVFVIRDERIQRMDIPDA
jgi:ketosteroid isomerase-like protein